MTSAPTPSPGAVGSTDSAKSSPWADTPATTAASIGVWDKFQHAGAYFVLTVMLVGIVERRAYPLAGVGALLFGGLIEIAQGTLTTTRVMDWHDLVANSTGIVAALGCAWLGLGGWALWVESRLGIR